MKKLYVLGITILFFATISYGQTIQNINARASGSTVIISYDLSSPDEGQKFKIDLKSSDDGFIRSLKEVSGDVGENQSVGLSKKIVWNARKELGSFKGDISFEITATVTFAPLKFVKPTAGTGVKIGKSYIVQWKGGTLDRNLKLELLKNNSQVIDMGNISNTGSYSWNVPKTMEKGENFQFKLFDPTKPNDAIMSAKFNMKKTPILLYIGGGAVIAGVAAAVIFGGDKGGVDCATNPTDPSCTGTTGAELALPPPPPGGGN